MKRNYLWIASILVLLIIAGIVYGFLHKTVSLTSSVSGTATSTSEKNKIAPKDLCAYLDDVIVTYQNSRGEIGGYAEFSDATSAHAQKKSVFFAWDAQGKGVDYGIPYITDSASGLAELIKKENEWVANVKKNFPIEEITTCPKS